MNSSFIVSYYFYNISIIGAYFYSHVYIIH